MKMPTPVIAVFDIGKTNKKLILFDKHYKLVFEQSVQFEEIIDEDGDPCEDIARLSQWVEQYLYTILSSDEFDVKALNVSAYGASFVHLDEQGMLVSPLYNYLKSYPEDLKALFYKTYGGEEKLSLQTASPVLGSLNSGMQLYRLKHHRKDVFDKVKYTLHLPQYFSWLISGHYATDITSIGCHTGLWDFSKSSYHQWVVDEGIDKKFAPVVPSTSIATIELAGKKVVAGVGMHDSSAALIPYLSTIQEEFILLSTGTWSISLNPFNETPLTPDELKRDCLCYLDYNGKPIKASRLFSGNEHEKQTNLLGELFLVQPDHYKTIQYNREIMQTLLFLKKSNLPMESIAFVQRDYSSYKTYEEAYHQLILDLVAMQFISTGLVLTQRTKHIFVDGGFSKNPVFMNVLAVFFPTHKIYAASVAQATALGAALVMHEHWNDCKLPSDLITLEHYIGNQVLEI